MFSRDNSKRQEYSAVKDILVHLFIIFVLVFFVIFFLLLKFCSFTWNENLSLSFFPSLFGSVCLQDPIMLCSLIFPIFSYPHIQLNPQFSLFVFFSLFMLFLAVSCSVTSVFYFCLRGLFFYPPVVNFFLTPFLFIFQHLSFCWHFLLCNIVFQSIFLFSLFSRSSL